MRTAMDHYRTLLIALGAVAAVTILSTQASAAPVRAMEKANLAPACSPDRPAVAHRDGGVRVTDEPTTPPIPCLVATGFRSSEVALVETMSGALLFQPAIYDNGSPIGVIRSVDGGTSWTATASSVVGNAPRVTPVDHDMTVDPQTGRVYWVVGAPGRTGQQPRLDVSDDDGMTWAKSPGSILPLGHGFVFAGPSPKKSKKFQKHPSTVYFCAGGMPQTCQGSTDGGLTFSAGVAIPFPPGSDSKCMNMGLRGVAGSDGTVYVPNAPCNRPYIAISHDQGATWRLVRIANDEIIGFGNLSIGLDRQGNLYAAWVSATDRLPYVSVSRDGGMRWGPALMIGAPGVTEAALPHLAAGARGHVAIAYYGSRNSPGKPFPAACLQPGGFMPSGIATSCPDWQNVTWNTYITETRNALASMPLFWSSALNDPDQPTWYGCSPSAVGATMGCTAYDIAPLPAWGRFDYFDIRMGVGGTIWTGFSQACPNGLPVPGNSHCPDSSKGAGADSLWGMVGWLAWPPRELKGK